MREFRPLDHIECCNNRGQPNLVIGSMYAVERVVSHWWVRWLFGREVWGVKVYGDPLPYHHSHFRWPTREYSTGDFNMKESPF